MRRRLRSGFATAVATCVCAAGLPLGAAGAAGAEALQTQKSGSSGKTETVRILGIDGVAGALEHPAGYQGTILDGPGNAVPAGGAAYLSASIDHLRAGSEHSVLLSTGDNLGGTTPDSALLDDRPMLESLRHMGLAASAIGESDLVAPAATTMSEHGFPYVASNLAPGQDAPVTPFPFVVLDVGSTKVGVVSATDDADNPIPQRPLVGPPSTASTPWTPTKKPLEPSFRAATDTLHSLGVDTVVGLLHMDSIHRQNDPNACPEQFSSVPELRDVSSSVDALLVGGSGGPATCDMSDPDNVRRPVLAPASHGRSVAVIDLEIDPETGRTLRDRSSTYNQRVNHDLTPDPAIEKIIADAKVEAEAVDEEPYGTTKRSISHAIEPGGESPLANLVADAEWETTSGLGADLAIYNPDSLTTDLPAGEQNYRSLREVIPYGDRINLADVSGERLLDAFGAYIDDVGTKGIAVSKNVSLSIDSSRPTGRKLVSASIDGRPIEPGRTYTVAAGEFLLSSEWGDAPLTTLHEEPRWSGLYDVQTLADYFREHHEVDPPATGQRLREVPKG
ncbi:bifunctional metallophosphatase/5'-nucleotidase [Dietzia sp.]|uniref:bifunctional metallophosphatase/5'-nucleotidase n=1 Tax=Dietzia sp. TaxID=1871616 RepID=UPI002FDA3996